MKFLPPKRALKFLRWFCRKDYLEEIEGDLVEMYELQYQDSVANARRQFMWNVIRTFRLRNLRKFYLFKNSNNTDMFKHISLLATRNLFRNKLSSSINIIGLTIGLSACVFIYIISSFELNHDAFHPQKERIFRITGKMKDNGTIGFVPYALPRAFREEISGLEKVAAFHNYEFEVKVIDEDNQEKEFARRDFENDPAQIIIAEPEYFEIFQYQWIVGNPSKALSEPFQVVLSEKKAALYFGDQSPGEIMGKEIIYDDSMRMTVTGIVKDFIEPTDLTFTDFISFRTINASRIKDHVHLDQWDDIWSASQAFVLLSENSTVKQIESQIPGFVKNHYQTDVDFVFTPQLQPLSQLHFDLKYGDNYSRKANMSVLYVLIGVALFILLIAVVNFINLSTAKYLERVNNMAMFRILGSAQKHLVFQYLVETFIIVALALGFALFLVPNLIVIFKDFIPEGISWHINGQTFLFLFIALTFTTVLAGLYPSLIVSSFKPALALKGQNPVMGRGKSYLRKGLIVFQFSVSIIFILGTILVSSQIRYMHKKNLGFNPNQVISVTLPRGAENKTRYMYEEIKQLAGVQKAALQLFEPMGLNFGVDKIIYRDGEDIQIDAAYKMGDEQFIPFYEMKLLVGRNFHKSDTAREFVITQSFVEAMGLSYPEEAIGKLLTWRDKQYPVVGVIEDFHQQSMRKMVPPTFITTSPWSRNIAVKLENLAAIDHIKKLWEKTFPDTLLEVKFLDSSIEKFYEKENKTATLLNVATLVAFFLCGLGLYGLSTFTAIQKSKEICIRKIMGATIGNILALLSKDFVRMIALAAAFAFPVSWYFMNNWLQDFVYHVHIKWWMFILAIVTTFIITVISVGFQGVSAALTNPVKNLKNEQ